MARIILLALVAVAALAVVVSGAASCDGAPFPIGNGGACTNPGGLGSIAAACTAGSYCDVTGGCATNVAVGSACNLDIPGICGTNSVCKGPTGATICVAYAGVGQACDPNSATTSTSTLPLCAPTLTAAINGSTCVCQSGQHNDKCTTNTDCQSGNCVNGACQAGGIGAMCTAANPCAPGLFCNMTLGAASICAPVLADNAPCVVPQVSAPFMNPCNFTSRCIGTGPTANNGTCTPFNTLQPGAFCGTSATQIGLLCQGSNRCVQANGGYYCAAGRVSQCVSSADCSFDEVCQCGVHTNIAGVASCRASACFSSMLSAGTCISNNCAPFGTLQGNYNSMSAEIQAYLAYPNSCANNLCSQQAIAYVQCSSATSLSISLAMVVLLAVVATLKL